MVVYNDSDWPIDFNLWAVDERKKSKRKNKRTTKRVVSKSAAHKRKPTKPKPVAR